MIACAPSITTGAKIPDDLLVVIAPVVPIEILTENDLAIEYGEALREWNACNTRIVGVKSLVDAAK